MKANCQFCQSGENEDKLLLCDGCARGYHTYCFKPQVEKIPQDDWFCFKCLNKARERKCIACGGNRPPPITKMIYCELCPRAYHRDCYIPPMAKPPRGKWYCVNYIWKAPPKPKRNSAKKKPSTNANDSQAGDTTANSTTGSIDPKNDPILATINDVIEAAVAIEEEQQAELPQLPPPPEVAPVKESGGSKSKSRSKSKKKSKDKDKDKDKRKEREREQRERERERQANQVDQSMEMDMKANYDKSVIMATVKNTHQSSMMMGTFNGSGSYAEAPSPLQ